MTIGLSFLCGLLASSVSFFMLGLWWPVAVLVGLFAWLAFGLLDVKMNSTFTLLGGMLLVFCVSLSAMVLRANDQLSGLQYSNSQDEEGTEFRYPVPPLGQARFGEKIYKASGCVACHTQQVTHESVALDVKAMAGEKNHAAVQEAVSRFYKLTGRKASGGAALGLPVGEWETIVTGANPADASKARNFLAAAGASVDVQVRFRGEDLMQHDILNPEGRGWGRRRSVAQDYLFAEPPMLGSVRIGPDLANVGARYSRDVLMRILLNPAIIWKNSKMPQHRFLFEEAAEDEQGQHIIHDGDKAYKPTAHAEALVDYLLSLKAANYPLLEAPIDQPFTSSLPDPAPDPAPPGEAADASQPVEAGK
ncbi:MAG: cbb3-type cytochrome c oxidase subunit II [Verrucomicrobiota bacterium]|nr:cbb3-type cytochrome c oxidase subunit II [Verrucomicrobiota bacterium]